MSKPDRPDSKQDKWDRLTPFEEYMFVDDTPAFPMYSCQGLRLTGSIDFDAFDQAYRLALARHPLLNSKVVRRGRKFFWEPNSDIPPIIRRTRPLGTAPEAVDWDIRTDSGMRLFLDTLTGPDGSAAEYEFFHQIHHTASDGIGMLRFLGDLFLLYGRLLGVIDADLPKLAEDSRVIRHDYGMTYAKYWRFLLRNTLSTLQLVARFPTPFLRQSQLDKSQPIVSYPRIIKTPLSVEETSAYHAAARRMGLTINDLLLRDIFVVMREFIDADEEKSGRPRGNKWLRIAMPINMRTEKHRAMYAANMVSMVFIDRRRRQIDASDAFAEGIHRTTEMIKNKEQGLVLLKNLEGRRVLPGGIEMEMAIKRCWSTTVLSNLGRILHRFPMPCDEQGRVKIGDLTIEDFFGCPPLRYKTLATWGVWSYAGRLQLAMRWDDRLMTPEQSRFLADLLQRRLKASCEGR